MAGVNRLAVIVHTGAVDKDFLDFVRAQPKVDQFEQSSDHFKVILDSTATQTDINTLKTAMLNKFIESATVTLQ